MKKQLSIALTFIWFGFIASISFMEAWLKFKSPLVTLPIGLSIGVLVFNALNKVEIGIAILLYFLQPQKNFFKKIVKNKTLQLLVAILIIQTFWLLPRLEQRAILIIQGGILQKSPLHFFYVLLECIKILCLAYQGKKLLKTDNSALLIK